MDYFGPEHLPYALLAVTVTVIFVAIPLLLAFLYPTRILHHRLQAMFSFQQALMLITFMEVYLGHFKDGTDGKWDCRYFAGGQLLTRVLIFIVFFQTQQQAGLNFFLMLVIVVTWSLLILMFTPYKRDAYNKLDCVVMYYVILILGLNSYNIAQGLVSHQQVCLELLLYVALFLPAFVSLLVCCISIARRCGCTWLHSKITIQGNNPQSSVYNSTMEVQHLLDPSANFHGDNSSDHMLASDRFAQHIGYGSI